MVLWVSAVCPQETGTIVTGEAKTTFLATWGERLQHMQSLHMVFRQEKVLQVLRQPLRARGELWLKGEILRYALTTTAGDTELVMRVDPQTVRTYYPLLQTVEVIELQNTKTLPSAMPLLHTSPETLAREYDVELLQNAERYTLQLRPKDPDAAVQEMRLVLQDFQPQALQQVEKNGTRIIMDIDVFTMNADISAAQLDLVIPEGTKVTYPLR